MSTYDVVIRNGTVVDGSGLGSFRADVGVVGDRIAFVGRILERGSRGDRRRGPRRDARLRRRPHAHGRAGVLGRVGQQLVLARRDHRGDGQLRVHARARAPGTPGRSSCATSSGPRTSTPPRWPPASSGPSRRFPEYLDAVDGLPEGHQLRGQHRPLGAADVGDGRAGVHGAGDRRRPEADARSAGRVDPRRRDRVLDVAQRAPRDLRQPPGRVAARVVGRGRAARRDDGRARRRASSRRPTAACSRPTPTSAKARSPATVSSRPATQVPITFGFVATQERRPRSSTSSTRRPSRAAASSARPTAGDLRPAVVQDAGPVRPAPRMGAPSGRAPRPSSSGSLRDDPAERQRLIDAARNADYSGWSGVGAEARPPDFEGIRVYEQGLPPNPTVADLARRAGRPPGRADGRPRGREPTSSSSSSSRACTRRTRQVLLRALRHPRTVMTFSDSGAHVSQICDASIHTHLLGYWVRDRQEFTLEEAVRMITLAPAAGVGVRRAGPRPRRDARRPQRVRPRHRRPRGARARRRPPGRPPPPDPAFGRLPRDRRRRRDHDRPGRVHRRDPGPPRTPPRRLA